jgi:hypothetical protein
LNGVPGFGFWEKIINLVMVRICSEKSFVGCVLRTMSLWQLRAQRPAAPTFSCVTGGPKAHEYLHRKLKPFKKIGR